MTIKVAINGRYTFKSQSGMNSWSAQVSDELSRLDSTVIQYRIIVPSKIFRNGILGHLWEQVIFPLRALGTDYIFCPSNFGPILSRKTVVVIHDIIPISHPELFSRFYANCAKYLTYIIAKQASLILTVSNFSKENIIHFLKVEAQKISVVGGGVSFAEVSNDNSPIESDFFLFVGGDNLRKNLDFLVDFWETIYSQTKVKLLVTTQGESKTFLNYTVPSNEYLVVVHKPSDESLRYFYRKCLALLWPSHVEGFGLPLLEVMAQGKPFLSLNTGIAQEICVNESRVLPPDKDIWQEEILKFCESRSSTDAGQISKATTYSWNSVACRTDDSIRQHSRK